MVSKRKAKTDTKTPNPKALVVGVRPDESKDRAIARELMAPSVQAAVTIQKFEQSDYDIQGFIAELRGQIDAVHSGDMKRSEAMLITQAHTLNELFNCLARRSAMNMGEYMNAAETYMRLALKAQSQCRATLETLSTVKNPPVIYARQANVTTGPQQVNNGIPSHMRENEIEQNKQSGGDSELLSDAGASQIESRIDPPMETVGEIDRPKIKRG